MRSQGECTYDGVSTLIRRNQRPEGDLSLSHSLSVSLSLSLCKDTACVNQEEGVHQESDCISILILDFQLSVQNHEK